jgi:hypothetical protein
MVLKVLNTLWGFDVIVTPVWQVSALQKIISCVTTHILEGFSQALSSEAVYSLRLKYLGMKKKNNYKSGSLGITADNESSTSVAASLQHVACWWVGLVA